MSHRSQTDIIAMLASLKVKSGQRYRHYKTGGIYTVRELVVLEANEAPAVAYYDDNLPSLVWIRAYDDFVAQIDGQPRFSLLP